MEELIDKVLWGAIDASCWSRHRGRTGVEVKVNRFIDCKEAGSQVGPGCASGWNECSRQVGGIDPKETMSRKRRKVRHGISSGEKSSD